MTVSRFLKLNTGHKMPTMGFGTYMLQGSALKEALDYALFLGYRHIDTAASYQNEEDIGQVISDRIRSGKLMRKDLFITSKLPPSAMRRTDALESAEKSLQRLSTTYLDMYLIHAPWAKKDNGDSDFEDIDVREPWGALVHLFKAGKMTSIGVSKFTVKQLDCIIAASNIVPANVQLECHPYLCQKKLAEYCASKHIVISAFAPLGSPNRPEKFLDNTESLLSDPVVTEIAKSYKKTPAQILLNFSLRRGFVVLPKSGKRERIKENMGALNFMVTREDFERIMSLDRRVRFFRYLYMRGHPAFDENEDF